jgi:dCMP deaminase
MNKKVLSKALKALCLTRDYVGEKTLPAIKGWEWFDACIEIVELIPEDEWAVQFWTRVGSDACKKKKMKRPDWDEYFFNIAEVVKTRSPCLRRQISAIAVKDKRILATGYNGPPTNTKHCVDRGGCMRERLNIPSGTQQEKCLAIHAEENLIVQAAIHGISLKGCEIYCTHQPCIMCARKIISIQPKYLSYLNHYPDQEAFDLFDEVANYGERVEKINGNTVSLWRFNHA